MAERRTTNGEMAERNAKIKATRKTDHQHTTQGGEFHFYSTAFSRSRLTTLN